MSDDTTTCDSCDGYGIISSKSGIMAVDLATIMRPSKKGGVMALDKAQDYLSKLQAIAARDTTTHTMCPKCGGSGS